MITIHVDENDPISLRHAREILDALDSIPLMRQREKRIRHRLQKYLVANGPVSQTKLISRFPSRDRRDAKRILEDLWHEGKIEREPIEGVIAWTEGASRLAGASHEL